MEDNGEVYVEGIYDGQIVSKNVKVSNIDKKIEDVTPVFCMTMVVQSLILWTEAVIR